MTCPPFCNECYRGYENCPEKHEHIETLSGPYTEEIKQLREAVSLPSNRFFLLTNTKLRGEIK